jgi:diacylglycerol kinase (ATP)
LRAWRYGRALERYTSGCRNEITPSVRVVVVVNVGSRRGHDLGEVALEELRKRGIEIVSVHNESHKIVEPHVDAIVVVGGDGTVTHAIPRALKAGIPVGIVPVGTFNELARTLEIPLDVAGACDLIAAGHARSIDVGRVNGSFFLAEASIGISSRAARWQNTEIKRRYGALGVIATALQAIAHARPMRVEVHYDSHVMHLRTMQLTIANSHRFGGVFAVSDAAIDDGWLDLYSVQIDHLREAIAVVWAFMRGRRKAVPGLRVLRAHKFVVRTRHRHHISADGEPAGKTPATFDVLPKALRVFSPE